MRNEPVRAKRLNGFDKQTVWNMMNALAIKTNSVNLGQGFPSWEPPEFYRRYLAEAVSTSSHQYIRGYGSLTYTQAIADFHKPTFGKIDHETEICVVNGGMEGLYCSIMGLMNPGEEAILFDPCYDCYRPQVQMAGGKSIGIPLLPKKVQTKAQLIKKIEHGIASDQNDQWDIDFQTLEKSLNERTKILIINNPHNPVGKIISHEELQKIADILKNYPRVVVIDDNVYDGSSFDNKFGTVLPKMHYIEEMKNRTISVYSAGKLLGATCMRSGWIIGAAPLISAARSVHQYNVYCQNHITENAVTHSLEELMKPDNTYKADIAKKLWKSRDTLIRELLKTDFDFSFWIPKGGVFLIIDISRIEVKEKYLFDEEGKRRTKDYAFVYQLAEEHKVICIPMSSFYDSKDQHLGEQYIRIAFCKDEEIILEASKRLNH